MNAQETYTAFFGNLHSHTSNSDGEGEPEDAFEYARYTAGIDFLAVTDHMEQIDMLEWYNVKNDADDATENGSFVAIAAWEWGSPLYGHINVFNTDEIISDVLNLWYYNDFDEFLDWLSENPPSIAQFNHPGDEETFNNWNDFEYVGESTDEIFALIEFQNVQQATDWYEFALSKGWHLSPVWNQDNHSADWGNKNNGRAGVWANTLTRAELFEAIIAGRTFATMDKNASVWIDINGVPMGGSLPVDHTMSLHINLTDTDVENYASIEVVSQNGIIHSITNFSGDFNAVIDISLGNDQWVFVRAVQTDGDYLWSAPVYLPGDVTGENIMQFQNEIKIFPNPASGVVRIEAGNITGNLDISTIDGKLVYRDALFNAVTTLNTNMFQPGCYLVRLQTEDSQYKSKLIVVK